MKLFVCMAALAITTLCSSCQKARSERKEPNLRKDIVLTEAQKKMLNRQNDFAFRFFHQIHTNEHADANVFVSPLSASLCLSMLMNGADGATYTEMMQTLNPGAKTTDIKEYNTFAKNLVDRLLEIDNTTQLGIANSIWINRQFPVFEDFIRVNRTMYNAEVESPYFASPNTLKIINGWCADKTHRLITKVLDEISPDAQMLLINAIYFKGAWSNPFSKSDTHPEPFGSSGTVEMMHQEDSYLYADNEYFAMAHLPYGNEAFGMTILLPHADKTMDECLAALTAENWRKWEHSFGMMELDLKMPKLQMRHKRNLIPDMQALGMKQAFNPAGADFSKISSADLFVGLLKQLTYLKVDEEGTEAAAVTATGVFMTSIKERKVIPFHVNRPYILMIRERSTGAILFMGKVMQPQQQ